MSNCYANCESMMTIKQCVFFLIYLFVCVFCTHIVLCINKNHREVIPREAKDKNHMDAICGETNFSPVISPILNLQIANILPVLNKDAENFVFTECSSGLRQHGTAPYTTPLSSTESLHMERGST